MMMSVSGVMDKTNVVVAGLVENRIFLDNCAESLRTWWLI